MCLQHRHVSARLLLESPKVFVICITSKYVKSECRNEQLPYLILMQNDSKNWSKLELSCLSIGNIVLRLK